MSSEHMSTTASILGTALSRLKDYYPFLIPRLSFIPLELQLLRSNPIVGVLCCLTMTKKVVSFAKKPIKRSNKRRRLRSVFRKFLNYMKSDTYMFSPLISPQSPATFSPASLVEGFGEPTKKQDKYLKCDCFMYAPMILDSAVETTSAPTDFDCCTLGVHSHRKENPSVRCNLIGRSSEETMLDIGNGMDSLRENVRDDCYTSTRRIPIKRALVPKERVKHAVHQNCRPMSIPGKGLFQKETHKIAVE